MDILKSAVDELRDTIRTPVENKAIYSVTVLDFRFSILIYRLKSSFQKLEIQTVTLYSRFLEFPPFVFKMFLNSFKTSLIIIFLLSTGLSSYATDSQKLDMAAAFQMALQNNKEIAVAQKIIDRSRLELKGASRFFQESPELTWEVKDRDKLNDKNRTDYGGALSFPVEIKGQRKYRKQKAIINIQIAELELDKKKEKIKNRLKELFLENYLLKEKISSIKKIFGIEENLMKIMEIQTKQGEIPRVKLNMIKLEMAQTKEELFKIMRSLTINRKNIEMITSQQIKKDIKIVSGLPGYSYFPNIEQIVNYAKQHNYEMKNIILRKERFLSDYKLKKSKVFMSNVSVALTYARDDNGNVTGGAVSIPLPFTTRKKSDALVAKKTIEIADLKKERKQRQLILEINQKYASIHNFAERKRIYEKEILPLAQQNIEDTKKLYEKGEINFLSFERVWDQWRGSRREYLDILQNYYGQLFSLELLAGGEMQEILKEGEQ